MARSRWAPIDRYVVSVVVAGAIALAVALVTTDDLFGDDHALVALFAALVVVAELNTLKWLRLDEGGEITSSWAFAIALVLVASPAAGMVVMAASALVADLARRKPLRRALFNGAQTSLALGLGSLVLAAFGVLDDLHRGDGDIDPIWFVGVALAGLVVFVANGILASTAIALHEGANVWELVRRTVPLNLMTDGTLVALAPIYVVVAQRSLLLLPLVLVTALLVHRNTRLSLAREHAANHDALTGLLNREAFRRELEHHLRRRVRSRGALVVLDLDGFREINERLGAHVGDEVLRDVGRRLVASHRPGQLVGRLGGDQFAVLLTRCESLDEARVEAHALRQLLARPAESLGFPIRVRATAAVAVWPDHGGVSDALFEALDLALHRAKADATGLEVATSGDNVLHRGRLGLLADLQRGIDDGELELHYQPELDIATGQVVAAEALVRWRHPRRGLVMPGEFIPYAEQTELMGALTDAVLQAALADCARWQRIAPVRVTVNVSAHSLRDLRFPGLVRDRLAAAHLASRMLELEITEHTVFDQPSRGREVLKELRALGVHVSIDDFGTGFSSLTNVRALPVSIVKIDRSFVDGMRRNPEDLEVVRAVVQLARGLQLATVAEGVEDTETIELLHLLGCDMVQGHAVAPGLPADEFVAWLTESVQRPARRPESA